jgi:phosphoribosyl 1,2-cyclic phosphodiesterase
MKIRFWGVRGSIATPGKDTMIYGGNTSCLEIEDDEGLCFVFDAGTGIRALGNDLMRRKQKETHLFITHTHWDHIQGFPFFTPAYIPGNSIKIYGPKHFEKTLQKIMDLQMDYAYFPVSMQQLNAKISYQDLQEARIQIGKTVITTKYSNHPVTGICYKVTGSSGKSIVYSGDTEPYYNVLEHEKKVKAGTSLAAGGKNPEQSPGGAIDFNDEFAANDSDENIDTIVAERNEAHKKFCSSDLLVHDAQYTEEEYPKFVGWGHSPQETVIKMAKEGGVGLLVLNHHDPAQTDESLMAIEKRLKEKYPDQKMVFSREGMELII